MAEYEFLTLWLVEAPIERVWDQLYDVASWPRWWKGVTSTRALAPGGPDGVGRVFAIAWRSYLPYELAFEITVRRVERPHLIDGHAVGELTGTGCWRLFQHAGVTAVTYEWRVHTTKTWMNLLAPVARGVFAHSHDHVMRQGGEGLARRLATQA